MDYVAATARESQCPDRPLRPTVDPKCFVHYVSSSLGQGGEEYIAVGPNGHRHLHRFVRRSR